MPQLRLQRAGRPLQLVCLQVRTQHLAACIPAALLATAHHQHARRNEIKHSQRERTVILQDVRADPTLPRTKDVECPNPSCLNHEVM